MQRGFLAVFTLINLLAAIHSPKRSAIYLYGVASMGCALLGAITAVRQVLLQNAHRSCWRLLASLHHMIENLSPGRRCN
jgi:disulfide bond formation protein DsbB